MKNNIFLKGEISTPIDTEEKPDEYGYYDSCTYAQVNYEEPEIGYYEVKCELTGKQCCEDHCPMEAKYTVREISKEEGERKMKYELKNNCKFWWVKGMVVEGEINERSEILEIDSIDICRLNKDIMSKEQIIECMKYPKRDFGKDYLKEIKPTFTMLEKLLLEHQLEMGYKYITRDLTNSRLNFFKNEPITNGSTWYGKNENDYGVFDMHLTELYPFVSWEDKEPTLIQDILDNYEVVEDEKLYNI